MTDEELSISDATLIARWDDYVESMGSVMGEVEHMAQQMRDRIEQLEAALRKIGKTYPADNMRLIHSELHILNIVNTALKGS